MPEILIILFAWVFSKFYYVLPFNPVPAYFVCRRGFLVPILAIIVGVVVDGISPFAPWISPLSFLIMYFTASYLVSVRGAVMLRTFILLFIYSSYELLRAEIWNYGVDVILLIRLLFTGGLIFYAFLRCGNE